MILRSLRNILLVALATQLLACGGGGGDSTPPVATTPPTATPPTSSTPQAPIAVGHANFLSPHSSPIAATGGFVFVSNTAADTLDVIDIASMAVIARVNVGIDPVGLAVRPDGGTD